jgi:hypothetical protein
MVVWTYNLSIQKAEEGRSRVWGQPGLYGETLIQNNIKKVFKKGSEALMEWLKL